ncbi:acetyl-CoA carboxylase [Microcella alkalica]|uniref:Biotin carboxyl carrier protein of acetyl-CoA carboxylase n=1 Tax=Microcella alkalica TaxID=355930 RepID=A0A839EA92_9MICO|nr:acetyl-CoA carboxylase [Microcella alkalica]MBA8847352.1 biotin carboxyl carrier protein [Microcella alkalica]
MTSTTIVAPAPGIFWQRPAPESDPFLTPGQSVMSGQQIGIIEVMKMFVEVTADRDGIFVKYHVDNGESVQMGASLVELEAGP